MSTKSVMLQIIGDGYEKIFIKTWPMWLGGLLVGILSVITFAWSRPWGVVGGLRNWADWFFYSVGVYGEAPFPAIISTNSILTFGLMAGAMAAALIARQVAFRKPPKLELAKGAVGGAMLGVGAALAGGCNVGGFYTAMSAMSLSSVTMWAGLILGAWVGLKYLYWEMEHLPTGGSIAPKAKEGGFDWKLVQPWIGGLLLAGLLVGSKVYSYHGYIFLGGLLLCGAGFGFILHRSRLCFARCFREPFMTGEAEVPQAVIISLLISMLGFATLKWVGLRSELAYVTPTFGLGGLLGGFIFGVGMLVTGGCGSGTAWRAVEGQGKLIVALIVFSLTNSLTRAAMDSWAWLGDVVGFSVYLPYYIGYEFTLIGMTVFLLLWLVVVKWNEETDAFVMEP